MQRTKICTVPWREKRWHFACPLKALTSGILKIWKKWQLSGFWHFFQIFKIPLLNPPNWHAKWFNLLHPVLHRSSQRPSGRRWFTLHASLECLKVEYCGSEKMSRFLRISGVWHFFQILKITGLQSESTFPSKHYTDPHSAGPAEVDSLCMLVWSTLKWNFADPKKVPDS